MCMNLEISQLQRDHVSHDSIYMKCLEMAIDTDKKYISGCLGLGGLVANGE